MQLNGDLSALLKDGGSSFHVVNMEFVNRSFSVGRLDKLFNSNVFLVEKVADLSFLAYFCKRFKHFKDR